MALTTPTFGASQASAITKAPASVKLPKLATAGSGAARAQTAAGRSAAPNTVSKAAPKPKVAKAAPFNPYAGLLVKDPYAAGTIDSTATSGYNADVARANTLAAMGLPTDATLTQQAADRAAGLGQIAQALSAHLAGVQQAGLQQGNQDSAAMGALDTAAAATGGHIPGAPASAGVVATPAAQATLAGQTAGTGNELGALEAASIQRGGYVQDQAINQGATDVTTNDENKQKALAGFLSGLPTVTSRESTMQQANQQTEQANATTKLNVWNQLQSQLTQDKLLNNKTAIAVDEDNTKQFIAQNGNETKAEIAKSNNLAKTTIAKGNNQTKTATTTQTNIEKGLIAKTNQANAVTIAKIRAGATIQAADIRSIAKSTKPYRVTVALPAQPTSTTGGTTTVKLPSSKNMSFTPSQWAKFLASGSKGSRNLAILGLPPKAKVNYNTVSGGGS